MKRLAMAACAAALAAGAATAEHHEGEAPEIAGFYKAEGWAATFTPDGYMVGVDSASGFAFVVGKYTAANGEMAYKDMAPPQDASAEVQACGTANKGRYSYTMTDGVLDFELIEDPCAERANAITTAVLTKTAPPED